MAKSEEYERNMSHVANYEYAFSLIEKNKRLKKLVNDLQKEIELKVLESQETHELEEK